MRLTRWLDGLRHDAKLATRQLTASPGFTLVAVITLALGIGANSAMFALADATFLRPLPFGGPADRLVMVWERRANNFTTMPSPLEFGEWNEQSRSFEAMASFATGSRTMRGADGTPEQVRGQVVTSTFFDVLAARPIAGRTFVPSDASPSPSLAVLSEGFWRRRFGADPALVGRDIVMDGQPLTVVGIMPASFQVVAPFSSGGAAVSDPVDLWTLAGDWGAGPARRSHFTHVIARLEPGVTVAAAQAEMSGVAAQVARDFPEPGVEHGVLVEPLRPALIGPELRLTSMLLVGVVGFVLLMCCANVANLLMSRTAARARELGVRSALGASRSRIALQLLTESLVLALAGGALGAAFGFLIIQLAPALFPPGLLPANLTLTFDLRVLIFCAVAACLVGVAFGLAPAWHSTRVSLVQAVASDARTTARGSVLRSMLVAAEVATAALVLIGAGLLLRAWITLDRVDPGYQPPEALTMQVTLPMSGGASRYATHDGLRDFYGAVRREIERQPGVRSAAVGGVLPLDGIWFMQGFRVAGDPLVGGQSFAAYHLVSPNYFETMNLPIVSGRPFRDQDTRNGVPVCIVSEAFVRRYLGERDPLGTRLSIPMMSLGGEPAPERVIVGVARQIRARPEELMPTPLIYVPIDQNAWFQASLIVRPQSGPAAAMLSPVRTALANVDPDRPVTRVRTLEDVASQATSRPRFRAVLVASFAMLALVLAMVGVFGVLAYSVEQRTRELGVRIALGASGASVLRLVLSGAGRIIAAGAAAGLAAAALLGRTISTFLFGVQPLDMLTFVLVPVVLLVTATIAVAAPALRATRIDPVEAFRSE